MCAANFMMAFFCVAHFCLSYVTKLFLRMGLKGMVSHLLYCGKVDQLNKCMYQKAK